MPALVPGSPLCQALAGQVEEGAALHTNWTAAWHRFGWLPEMFEMSLDHRHPTLTGECVITHRFSNVWLPEMFEISLDHRHPTLTGERMS